MSPVFRNQNGRSVPAAKFLGSNNGMRCVEAGQAIVSGVEWSHPSKIGDITLIFVKALSVAAVRKKTAGVVGAVARPRSPVLAEASRKRIVSC